MRTPSTVRTWDLALPIVALAVLVAIPAASPGATDRGIAGRPVPSDPVSTRASALVRPTVNVPPLSVQIILPNIVWPVESTVVSALAYGGVPFEGPSRAYRFLWSASTGISGTDPSFEFIAPVSGTVIATVRVWDALNDTVEASIAMDVKAGPMIALEPAIGATDTDLPIPFSIAVAGTSPPFNLMWTTLPGGAHNKSQMAEPGTVQVHGSSHSPGYDWVEANVTDGDGLSASVEGVIAQVNPLPTLELDPPYPAPAVGEPTAVDGLVAGGTPPFSWTVESNLPTADDAGASATDVPNGTIGWSARYLAPGAAILLVQVVDACGAITWSNLTFPVAGTLDPALLLPPSGAVVGAPLNLTVNLSGGSPPYSYALRLSDGESGSGVAATPGPIEFVAFPRAPGQLSISVEIRDAAASTEMLNGTVDVRAADPPPPAVRTAAPSPWPSVAGVAALGLFLTVGLGWAFWRRRRGPRGPDREPAARAAEIVGRLLREGDGIDPLTLRVLAEEEGLTPGEIDSAVDSLRTNGRLLVESGFEGSESWRWRPDPTAAAPTPGGSP